MPSYSGIFTLQAQMQAIAAGTWTMAPGAPTIGTATGGNELASVAFTAPAFTGVPAGVTGYTVTSSPGGLTGTGASSPISVTGLTNGTAYTFTVTATGASGVGSPSAASNSVTPVLAIGDAFGGGYYAGQIGVGGVATHYLIVGPFASAQSSSTLQWKNANTTTAGADSVIDGPQNTADMVADGSATVYPPAHFCNNLTIGGFSDWYLPAKNELEVCYYNLKPTTANNVTSSGTNTNAVPSRASNYTSGTPARTSVSIFQEGNSEAFYGVGTSYWSSTEAAAASAAGQLFYHGNQDNGSKSYSRLVRGIRRVAV